MFLFNSCPRCGGDVRCRKTDAGVECDCVQCGRPLELAIARDLIAKRVAVRTAAETQTAA